MEEEKQPRIYHKIEPDRKYRVWKKTYNDVDYYKIKVQQKNYDGTVDTFYQEIRFKKNVSVPNETDIKIKEAYENLRKNPKDEYNPISYLVITEFEKLESQEQIQKNALDEFNDVMDEIDSEDLELPF